MFNPADYPISVGIVVFIAGWVGGVFSPVVSDRITEWLRHRKESKQIEEGFDRCRREMPKLIDEMAQDVSSQLQYEGMVRDIRFVYGRSSSDYFVYFTDTTLTEDKFDEEGKLWVHTNLPSKIRMLANAGFVIDLDGSATHFRMTEDFVDLLKRKIPVKSNPPASPSPPS